MNPTVPHMLPVASRREFLYRAGGGFGALVFSYLFGLDGFFVRVVGDALVNPFGSKPPHHPHTTKTII